MEFENTWNIIAFPGTEPHTATTLALSYRNNTVHQHVSSMKPAWCRLRGDESQIWTDEINLEGGWDTGINFHANGRGPSVYSGIE